MGAHNYRLFWRGWEDDFPFPRRSTKHRCFWFTQGPHTLRFWSRSLGLQESALSGGNSEYPTPYEAMSDGTFAVPLVLRVFFAVELSTWRSTSSIRQLLQKVGNFWVLSQHVSSCRDHRKVRTIPKIEVQEVVRSLSKKMGVSFLSSFTWTYLEKIDTTKVKTVPKVQVRDELVTCESCHEPWINGERINWTANPLGLVTSWAYFR